MTEVELRAASRHRGGRVQPPSVRESRKASAHTWRNDRTGEREKSVASRASVIYMYRVDTILACRRGAAIKTPPAGEGPNEHACNHGSLANRRSAAPHLPCEVGNFEEWERYTYITVITII